MPHARSRTTMTTVFAVQTAVDGAARRRWCPAPGFLVARGCPGPSPSHEVALSRSAGWTAPRPTSRIDLAG